MKIITYNVNGIRAAMRKGWLEWLEMENPDVMCLQEIKATADVVPNLAYLEQLGYEHYWYPAQKKGYSGTAILTKISPKHVEYGCGESLYDSEGRIMRMDFEDLSVLSTYFPSGTTGDIRQEFKYRFLDDFQLYIDGLQEYQPNLVIAGDYNICHKAMDIHNPVSNKNSSGFLPQEREWMSAFLDSGFVDSFRSLNPQPHHYTWWSYRAGARPKNLGWRIDYHMVSTPLANQIKECTILQDVVHSDHCPVSLTLHP